MVRTHALLAVCALVVVAGCLGGGAGTTATRTTTPTPADTTATRTTADTTTVRTTAGTRTASDEAVGERAIAAEKRRVERTMATYETVTDLSFGILRLPDYEVVRRNESGAVVRASVGYSVEVDCDGDGEPDSSADGAKTVATYLVAGDDVRLLGVSQDVPREEVYC